MSGDLATPVYVRQVFDFIRCSEDGKINMCKAIMDWMEESRKEGKEEGREEGILMEAERINQLNLLLSEQGRMDDLVRAAKDREYQERLFREVLGQQHG